MKSIPKSISLEKLPDKYLRIYNKIYIQSFSRFNKDLEYISREHKNNIDWLVSNSFSRNNHLSNFYKYYCQLLFVKKILFNRNNIEKIIVESKALREILKKYLKFEKINIKIIYSKKIKLRIKDFIYPYLTLLRSTYHFFIQFIGCNFYLRKGYRLNEPITLLDTFILPEYFEDGVHKERYYNDIYDFLSKQEKEKIFQLPFIFFSKNYVSLFNNIKKSTTNFLFKEHFLSTSDYMFALLFFFRMKSLKIREFSMEGFSLSPIIKEDNFNWKVISLSMVGLLNYRFARRLKKKIFQFG